MFSISRESARVVYHKEVERELQHGPIAGDMSDRMERVANTARSRVRVLSGRTRGSIQVEPESISGDLVEVDVSIGPNNTGFSVAKALEYGTSHQPAYPFFVSSLEDEF